MKYKIDLHTICYNEIKIAPFAIEYWKLFADHVYVYDSGSTDGCLELFAQYPDWITVVHYDTDGFQDDVNEHIKSTCWMNSTADICVVTEFDEFIYCKDWDAEIDFLNANNVALCGEQIYNMVFDVFPEYSPGVLIHKINGAKGKFDPGFGKTCIINPHKCEVLQYTPGGHNVCGRINGYRAISNNIYLFHNKYLGIEYLIDRFRFYDSRQNENDKLHGWGVEYRWNDETIIAKFNSIKEAAVSTENF